MTAMDRRDALSSIIMASAATLFIGSCADDHAIEFLTDGKLLLDESHQAYVAVISETLLPVKALSPHIPAAGEFIVRMLNECHRQEDVRRFTLGFDQYKLLMKESRSKITNENADRAISVIESSLAAAEPQEELIYFIDRIKSLSLKNLETSEYYLTEKYNYNQIPPPYEACASA